MAEKRRIVQMSRTNDWTSYGIDVRLGADVVNVPILQAVDLVRCYEGAVLKTHENMAKLRAASMRGREKSIKGDEKFIPAVQYFEEFLSAEYMLGEMCGHDKIKDGLRENGRVSRAIAAYRMAHPGDVVDVKTEAESYTHDATPRPKALTYADLSKITSRKHTDLPSLIELM